MNKEIFLLIMKSLVASRESVVTTIRHSEFIRTCSSEIFDLLIYLRLDDTYIYIEVKGGVCRKRTILFIRTTKQVTQL